MSTIKLSEAKKWWTVYSTGLQRRLIKTTASAFVSHEDAVRWAHKQEDKGLDVRIEQEKATEL